jgi:two-component system LytT family response regulator
MTAGRLPFSAPYPQETIARILQSQPEPIARYNYDLPEGLERIIRKCLEKDRERRYQSARELLVDLRSLETPQPAGHARANAPVRVVIVDDEELARNLLREYLASCPEVEIAAECANGFEAVKAIGQLKPDLVLLDVQMPKLDGFEVLELIDPACAVIFVTAFDTFAMRAFDAHAVDYLLKPFSLDRFRTALDRARQRLREKGVATVVPAAELAAAARPPDQFLDRIVVKDGAKVHIIRAEHLDYAEAQDDYVALHSQGKSYLKQQTISSLETALDPQRFIRIHRGYLVNLERIVKIEPYTKDSRVAVLSDGSRLPVSKAGYTKLQELL